LNEALKINTEMQFSENDTDTGDSPWR